MKRSKNDVVVTPSTVRVLDGLDAVTYKAAEAGAPKKILDVLRAARDKVERVGARFARAEAREIRAAQHKAKVAEREAKAKARAAARAKALRERLQKLEAQAEKLGLKL